MSDSSDSDSDFDSMVDQVVVASIQAAQLVGQLVATGVLTNDGEGPSNKRPRAPNKERGREDGHDKLVADYFSNNPVYSEDDFNRRFRMSRRLFLRIVNDLEREVEYFKQHWDARGVKGFSALQKCTSAIRQLAYGSAADASDEYLRMSETTSRECLELFCKGIIYLYMRQYFQESARKDIERTFATLQSKWHVVERPARSWSQRKLQEIMYTCIILHNMIREDEGISNYPFDPTEVLPDDIETTISEEDRARNVSLVKNRERHANLRHDLSQHVWNSRANN